MSVSSTIAGVPTSTSLMLTGATSNGIFPTPTLSSNISSSNITSSIISSITPISISTTTTTSTAPATTTTNGNDFVPGLNDTTAQKYLQDARNTLDIGSQFTICIVAGLIFFLAFCIFRTRIPVLFAPRLNMKRHKPPELSTSLFGWIIPLLKIGDEEMLTNVGLDALLMLKFITMGIKIFSICTLFGLVVFIPMTMTSDYQHLENTTAIDRVSIAVIENGSNKLIAYLIFAYIFTFITFFFLKNSYHEYVYLRAKFLLTQSKMMVSRSIVVTGIPQHLRSDEALAEYYENLGIGPVESCYVVREVQRLETMIKKRASALMKLEEAYAQYWGNPCRIPGYDPDRILDDVEMYKKVLDLAEKRDSSSSDSSSDEEGAEGYEKSKTVKKESTLVRRSKSAKKKLGNTTFFKGLVEPTLGLAKTKAKSKRPTVRIGGLWGLFGKKVDAIEYYTKLFDDLDKIVIERRRSPNYTMTNVAFVTFEHMSSAVIASQIAINPEPFNLRTSMACEPRDVLWSSVAIRGRERIVREAIIWIITILLCITWFVPVGAVSSLLSVKSIAKINQAAAEKIENSNIAKLIFGSFVPTVILNIFTSVLPFIFDAMGYYQGLRSRSAVAESTLSKYYFFLIFLTLIFYSIVGTTVITLLQNFTNNLQQIPIFIANVLPSLAPFFINYTILQAFLVMPLNLLLLGSIIIRGFWHLFICSTPREHAENRAPWAFNYGIGYPAPLLIFAIVFEYSLICPLVLLFGTIYFCITYVVYKYQFLYVYFRPYEAAGKLWTMVIPRIIFTLVLFQLTMMGLFLLRASYILGGLVVPLIVFTFLFNYLLDRAYKKNGQNLPMQLLRDNQQKLPNGSDIEEDDDDDDDDDDDIFNNERHHVVNSNNRKDNSNAEVSTIENKKEHEKKMEARNRWKTAAKSAINLKTEPTPEEKSTALIRPRHRKVILDEDDYEATPSRLTDYRQPPMQLNPGLLDAGLKKYGNPLLVGVLPQLWLPVKVPVEGETKKDQSERRKSDLLHNRVSGGGNLAQHLAEILRKVENDSQAKEELRSKTATTNDLEGPSKTHHDDREAQDTLIEDSRKIAHNDATSIVEGRPRHPKITALRTLFKRGAIKQTNSSDSVGTPNTFTSAQEFRMQHMNDDDAAIVDSLERGQHVKEDTSSSRTSSAKTIHQTYYHHPDRRKSHGANAEIFSHQQRPEHKTSNLSAPIFPPLANDIAHHKEDHDGDLAESVARPDTRNSRHSSAPLIDKSNKDN